MEANLDAIIRSKQPLSDAHFQCFLYQILCGLKYIHSAGVIHRDLKPRHLLVNADCELKICDFGSAGGFVSWGAEELVKSSGKDFMIYNVGSRWYRAPEIMLGSPGYTKAIDMWSVGCIFAELIGGKPIFAGEDAMDDIQRILQHTGRPSGEVLRRVASPIAGNYLSSRPPTSRIRLTKRYIDANPLALDLLAKMLELDPDERISCENTLNHPYLAIWHDPADEPVCSSTFDFSFEEQVSQAAIMGMIANELRHFKLEAGA